jgi:ABC-type nitrate/sulfonate/bicarbonate transport system ATPase subunit
MRPVLSINHLSKSFGTLQVLHDVSIQVNKNEFVSVIGPSGCGKSSLFHIISGIEQESLGEIILENKKIKNRKGKFGYMPQDASLLPWKTVIENIMIGPLLGGIPKNKAEEKAKQMLKKFNLEDFSDAYPFTLSGGMQQRVALLRTVLFHPAFLLLDEPFGSLDALTRQHAQIWLLDVWKNYQSSVLFITHDIQEAILLSDRIYVLSDRPGMIVKEVIVNLPRPRKHTDLTKVKGISLEKKLLSLLMHT